MIIKKLNLLWSNKAQYKRQANNGFTNSCGASGASGSRVSRKFLYTPVGDRDHTGVDNTDNNQQKNLQTKDKEYLVKAGERFVTRCQCRRVNKPQIKCKNMDDKCSGKTNVTRNKSKNDSGKNRVSPKKNNAKTQQPSCSPLASISISRLHLNNESVCPSNNVAQCTCLIALNVALSRRRDAVSELDVDERNGLIMYIEKEVKQGLINRYFWRITTSPGILSLEST